MTHTIISKSADSPARRLHFEERPAILMVDDQPARHITYDVILADLAVERVHALSAREALARLLEREFAVILLDVQMPEMDGFELARHIREHPRLERTPIIFVTGVHINEMDRLKGYEVGAVDYMSVPVVPEILRSKVAVLIELHQRRSELQSLNKALEDTRKLLAAERAQALTDKENYRRAIFEHPNDFMCVLQAERDSTGRIVDWLFRDANRNALTITEMSREAFVGQRLTEVFSEHAERLSAIYARVLATGNSEQYETNRGELHFLMTVYSIGDDLIVSSGTDITTRKRSEQQSRADAERFQLIAETLPHIVWSARADGFCDYYNQRFLDYLGITRDDMQGDAWIRTLHPDDVPVAVAAWTHAVKTREDYAMEFRIRGSDGQYRWHEARAAALHDDKGGVIRWFGTCTDVHDRRVATDALRESERRHRALLDNAPVCVAHNRMDGRFQYVNQAFCDLVGYTAEELHARTWQEITHPDDVLDDQSLGYKVLSGELPDYTMEKRYIRKDGSHVSVKLFGNFVLDEQRRPVLGVAVAIDITERQLAEGALRKSEARFRELANNIDQLVWTCDELGHATWYNDRWYEYTGTTFEQMRNDGWMTVHDPAFVDRVSAGLKHSLATGKPWEDTFPLRGKDGHYRWFLSRAIPIHDDRGHVVRWMGTNTDITELRRLQDELKENDRRKDEFLAMLAHELRNPVAPIQNATEVLSRIIHEHKPERALIEVIQRQTKQLTVLLDDLLDSARVTQGLVELRREVVSAQTCVDLAVEAAEPLMREKQHRLTVTHATKRSFVNVDKARLTQCLTNLLTNAAKFTNVGGEIEVRLDTFDDQLIIEVKDTGIGIERDLLPRIFDVFAQGERTLDRSQGGLGIGLSVCKRLVELQGGTVSAYSAGPGKGATFQIRLPLVEETAPTGETEQRRSKTPQRILVVDDNRDAADTLSTLLQLKGHQTRTVYSAERAIEVAKSFSPHIIFLDIGLPVMNGYEIARRIKSTVGNSVRLVAVTGYGQRADEKRSIEAGFEMHLVKPIDLSKLDSLLSK